MTGQPLPVRQEHHVAGDVFQPLTGEPHDARALAEVVHVQAAGEPGGAAGRQHVRRPGRVVAHRHRRERPQEHRARAVDLFHQRVGVAGLHVQVFRRDRVHAIDRRGLVRRQHQRAVPFEAVAGEVGARQFREPLLERRVDLVDERFVPRHQYRDARRVLRLCDEVERDVIRVGGVVRQHDDFARPGDAVDGDLPEHVLLRERDVLVAGADDDIDRLQPFDAVGERRDRLRAAETVHLGDAEFVARREHLAVVPALIVGRHAHRDLIAAGRLRRAHGHQQRGRVRRRTARAVHADALQRPVPHLKLVLPGDAHLRVAVQQPGLELEDVVPDLPDDLEEVITDGRVGRGQLGRLDAQLIRLKLHAVEEFGVLERGGQPLLAHVGADALDRPRRRQGLAEHRLRLLPAGGRHHLGVGVELVAEFDDLGRGVGRCEIDPPQLESRHLVNLAGSRGETDARRDWDFATLPDPHKLRAG